MMLALCSGCELLLKSEPGADNMVYVKGGTFQMGDTFDHFFNNGKPVHGVTVSNFYLGRYEVTQAEWLAYSDTNLAWFRNDSLPIEQVDWFDVFVYCNLRSLAEGLTPCYSMGGKALPLNFNYIREQGPMYGPDTLHPSVKCDFSVNGYRLPTEAEWEFAAKGGRKSKGFVFSGSDSLDEVAWYADNSDSRTHPVGTKKSNELGLYDMSGNVIERVWDWYQEYDPKHQYNPWGPSDGNIRIMRGGSWSGDGRYCEVTYRYTHPSWRDYTTGFRLCRSVAK
jgi:formylglycine-generating enzyme required for sulfatase activity